MTTRRKQFVRHAWLPLAWVAGAALILGGRHDTFDPSSREYGANWPGDLRGAFVQLTVEIAILYLILRPWSYRHAWRRSAAALALAVPWTALSTLAIMHTGRIWHALWFWNVLLLPALLVATIVSNAAENAARNHEGASYPGRSS